MLIDSFICKLENKFPNYKDFYEVVEYISDDNIIIKDKYGYLKSTKYGLWQKRIPNIQSATNKLDYAKSIIKESFPNYEEYFEVIDYIYIKVRGFNEGKVLIKDEFGVCSSFVGHLKDKKIPQITASLDKQNYFKNKLIKVNKHYRDGLFEIVGEYINSHTHIAVRTEFGDCLVKPNNLLRGDIPIIDSAVCKTTYFLNKLKKIQPNVYSTYNFEKFIYENNTDKVIIICKKHGEILMSPATLLRGNGCINCGYEKSRDFKRYRQEINFSHHSWIQQGEKSKNFKSFKVYILKCYNENEEFYKIGKTFKNIDQRFYKSNIPYDYEVVKVFESKTDGLYISKLEKELQKLNKDNKYLPKIEFAGMYECFKIVNYEL